MLRTTAKQEIEKHERALLTIKKFTMDKVAESYRLSYTNSTYEQSYKYAERKLKHIIKEHELEIEKYENFLDALEHILYKINYNEESEDLLIEEIIVT